MPVDFESGPVCALVRDISLEHCIPFVGAGFSANAKGGNVPCYGELATRLHRYLPSEYQTVELSPSKTIEILVDKYGEQIVRNWICEEIGDPDPAGVHAAFVEIPWRIIITTNYDRLIEKAFSDFGIGRYPVVCNSDRQLKTLSTDLDTTRAPLIINAHGACIFRDAMVVDPSSFDEIHFNKSHPMLCDFLRRHLKDRSAVFIGYSLDDRNISFLRKAIEVSARENNGSSRSDYLIAIDPSDADLGKWNADRSLVVIELDASANGMTKGECLEWFLLKAKERMTRSLVAATSSIGAMRYYVEGK